MLFVSAEVNADTFPSVKTASKLDQLYIFLIKIFKRTCPTNPIHKLCHYLIIVTQWPEKVILWTSTDFVEIHCEHSHRLNITHIVIGSAT